ncbi:MAG: hypothetical protein M3Q36_02700 [bacterium]|nr:hypothetical protein [bacterium]
MNKLFKHEDGFSLVEGVLILAVLTLFGFIGWRVYQSNKSVESDSTTSQQTIEKAEDLDKTVDELDAQDIDKQLDTSELDAALES